MLVSLLLIYEENNMELLKINNYTIYFEEKNKMLVCYKGNTFHRLLPYHKPVKTIFQLKDDARSWFEEWVNNKPKPNYIIESIEDSAETMASFRNSLYTTEIS